MKARFSSQQPPVKYIEKDGIAYIYICQNETPGQETYPDMGEGETIESYYEYDYNKIIGPVSEIPVDDIQLHPENYLEYEYKPQASDPDVQALAEVQELKAAIERGLTI